MGWDKINEILKRVTWMDDDTNALMGEDDGDVEKKKINLFQKIAQFTNGVKAVIAENTKIKKITLQTEKEKRAQKIEQLVKVATLRKLKRHSDTKRKEYILEKTKLDTMHANEKKLTQRKVLQSLERDIKKSIS